ncbi:MAG TPA: flagellar export chaperone FliS [Dehalococcoidia bacterium]
MNVSAYQQYRRVQLQTATPSELVLMLYDGAVRFLAQAEAAMAGQDIKAAHGAVLRAQAILEELMACLRQDDNQIGPALMSLYAYMHRRLMEANVRKDAGRVREVRGLLERLRDAWREAVRATAASVQEGTTVALSPPA